MFFHPIIRQLPRLFLSFQFMRSSYRMLIRVRPIQFLSEAVARHLLILRLVCTSRRSGVICTEDHLVTVALTPRHFVVGDGGRGWLHPLLLASPEVPSAYYEGEDDNACYRYARDCATSYT